MKTRTIKIGALLMGTFALVGCSDVRDVFGTRKDPPDEFQVVARAPLALPPNFDLRPPEPGVDRPQEGSTTDMAARRILGRGAAGTSSAAAPAWLSGSGFGTSFAACTPPQAAPTPSVGVSSTG